MTYTRRACPTCDGYLAEQIHRLRLKTPDGHPLQDGYDVVACLSCGTGFADVEIAQDYYDLYYANQAKYVSEAATETQTVSAAEPAWKAERLKDAASLIASMLEDKDSRILDIGCANGTLLGALQEVGFLDVRGIDPSPGSAVMAKSHYGVQVDVGTFSDLPSDLGTYDCVCVTGVLEHVFDIKSAMTTLVELLRPGGIIYVDVPDASRYLQPYISPFEDFSTEHVNHFSLSTLKTLGNRFGLATLHSDQFITELALGVPCAAIRLVWQQRPSHRHFSGVIRDEELVASLYDFTSRSQAEFVEIDHQLEARLIDQDEFAIWGMGEYTFKLLATEPLERRKAVALVDGNPARWCMSVGGVRVDSPDSLSTLSASVPLIIGSRLSEQSIRLAIAKLRLENPVLST